VGAYPIFVDIDLATFNIDPASVEAAITPRTRAIMPVHLFGLPVDMDPMLKIARSNNLAVIEDAAQAIGARYKDNYVGTLGDFGCFSFFPSKNLGGAGDGGLVTTNHQAMAERLRMLRVHGSRRKYHHDILGTNSRLDALQAAILRVKLRHLDAWAAARASRADRYRMLFEPQLESALLTFPVKSPAEFHHVYNQFTIRCSCRDELREFLKQAGVPSEVYYPLCLHLQSAFAYLGHAKGAFPIAERASREALSLPVFPELSDALQDLVVRTIVDFYARKQNTRS
jgi:dTDP-4-amino-4,6-dideoxygalactose transaminase